MADDRPSSSDGPKPDTPSPSMAISSMSNPISSMPSINTMTSAPLFKDALTSFAAALRHHQHPLFTAFDGYVNRENERIQCVFRLHFWRYTGARARARQKSGLSRSLKKYFVESFQINVCII